MTLATKLNGTFSLAELERLKFPVAWSVTVPEAEREAEESALRALAREATEELQAAYDHAELADGKELEIRIVDGEITDIVEV